MDLVLFRLYLVDGAELDGADPAAIDQLGPEVIEVAGFEQVPDRRRLLLQLIDDDQLSTQLPLFRRKLVLRRHESRLCRGQIGLDLLQLHLRGGDLRLCGRYLRVERADDRAQLRLLILGSRDLRSETRDLLVDLRLLVLGGLDLVGVLVRGHARGDTDEHRGDDKCHRGFHQLYTLRNRRTPM